MDELARANGDADVRRSATHGFKKEQIAWLNMAGINHLADERLIVNVTRQTHAELIEDPLHEAAAIESGRVAAAVAIAGALQSERGRDYRCAERRLHRRGNNWVGRSRSVGRRRRSARRDGGARKRVWDGTGRCARGERQHARGDGETGGNLHAGIIGVTCCGD